MTDPLSRRLTRLRYPVLVVWGLAWFADTFHRTGNGLTDWRVFEGGARVLISYHHLYGYSGGALHLYENYPFIQVGPPALLPLVPFQWVTPITLALAFGIVMSLAGAVVVALCEGVARQVRPTQSGTAGGAFLGGLAVTAAWSHDVGLFRHLDDTMAITLSCGAALVVARRGRWWVVGLLLGTACATKPWAVALVPLLLALPRAQWARTGLLVLVSGTAWWAPFLIAAPGSVSALGHYHLVPIPGSVPYLLGLHGDVSGWLRPVQAALGVLAGTLVVRQGRWTAAPLAGLAMRVAVDPYAFTYYGMGPMAAALLWDLTRPRGRLPIWTAATLLVEYLIPLVSPYQLAAVGRAVWAAAVVALLVARRRVETHDPPRVDGSLTPQVAR